MSEYETGPGWAYDGLTAQDVRGCRVGPYSAAARLGGALRCPVFPAYRMGPGAVTQWQEDWQDAYARELQRVQDNRARWEAVNAPGREGREELVAQGVTGDPARVNRTALVAYRCKSHGCLLAAVLQVQGHRYQFVRPYRELGHVDGEDALENGIAGSSTPGVQSAAVERALSEIRNSRDEETGGVADWSPESLAEWMEVSDDAVEWGTPWCVELPPWVMFVDTVLNCRHVEYRPAGDVVAADVERLRGKRNRVVYVDSRGPVRPGR